jgi:membrane protein
MDILKIYNKIYTLTRDGRYRDISLYASAGTYYLFLSLAPLAALLLALLPHAGLSQAELLELLLGYTPPAFQTLMNAIINQVYNRSWTVLSVSFLLELWSAAKFLSAVLNGISRIYGQEGRYRGFFRRRLAGALYTLALVLFIPANAALLLFGQRWFSPNGHITALLRLRGLFFSASLTLLLTLLFSAVSRQSPRFFRQLPGAAGAAVGWLLFSRVYTWAAGRFGLFGIYGSLALLSVSLFWMYGSVYILFLGACVNTLLPNNKRYNSNKNN